MFYSQKRPSPFLELLFFELIFNRNSLFFSVFVFFLLFSSFFFFFLLFSYILTWFSLKKNVHSFKKKRAFFQKNTFFSGSKTPWTFLGVNIFLDVFGSKSCWKRRFFTGNGSKLSFFVFLCLFSTSFWTFLGVADSQKRPKIHNTSAHKILTTQFVWIREGIFFTLIFLKQTSSKMLFIAP